MNHKLLNSKKEGITDIESQMIPLQPPNSFPLSLERHCKVVRMKNKKAETSYDLVIQHTHDHRLERQKRKAWSLGYSGISDVLWH